MLVAEISCDVTGSILLLMAGMAAEKNVEQLASVAPRSAILVKSILGIGFEN